MSLFFEVIFQNNSNDRIQVGSYVLSFRPVALQIRTILGGVGSGGKSLAKIVDSKQFWSKNIFVPENLDPKNRRHKKFLSNKM